MPFGGMNLLGVAGPVNINILVIVTVIYVLLIGYLGFRGYRGTKTATDYLLAGRNIHPYVMALSYGATFISTSAIVGFGGVAAALGMGVLWLTFLNIFVGIFIAFVFLGKRTRKMGHNLDAHTFPELLGRRYQSRFVQMFTAVVIFLIMPLYAAAVLRGGAEFIKITFGIELAVAVFIFALIIAAYVVAGGLKGVMFTDALQGSIMFVGMLALLGFTYVKLGGFTHAHQALTDMAAQVPEKLVAGGHQGWTSMPRFPSAIWFELITTIVLGVGIGVLAQPQLAVRFMTVKSGRQLNRAVLIGGIFILMMTGVAFVVGALSNVYFMETQGVIALVAGKGNVDEIIPAYINAAMPAWFVVVFMLTLLSAAMSTLSSQFHAMGTSIGRDIYEEGIQRGKIGQRSILVTRLGIIIAFIIVVWLSLKMPPSIIAAATAIFFGTCAVAFLPMFIGGLYFRRMNRAGAMSGMVVGFLASLIWLLFFHFKNGPRVGLCGFLFDQDYIKLPGYWNIIDPLIIGLPLSIIVTIIVTILTKPMEDSHVSKCMDGIGKNVTPPLSEETDPASDPQVA